MLLWSVDGMLRGGIVSGNIDLSGAGASFARGMTIAGEVMLWCRFLTAGTGDLPLGYATLVRTYSGYAHRILLSMPTANLTRDARPAARFSDLVGTAGEWRVRVFTALAGAFLGLAAPGLEQWYLPWFAVTSLLILTVTAKEAWLAAVRGFFFGTAYNLVYLNWFLTLRPVYCEGNFQALPLMLAAIYWILVSAWQGVYIATFPCLLHQIARRSRLIGGWLPVKRDGRWLFPSFLLIPLLWVLLDRMCNTTQLVGMPWSALHYTQYRQLPLLQVASVIGGVGISAWILLVNANLVALIAYISAAQRLLPLACLSVRSLILNSAVTFLLSTCLVGYGFWRLTLESKSLAAKPKIMVTALQAGVSSKAHKLGADRLVKKYIELCAASPRNSLVVWPEWSIALNFSTHRHLLNCIGIIPRQDNQDWVFGLFDRDSQGRLYNAVAALSRKGELAQEVYRKRYLVPMGEYTLDWVRETPLGGIAYGFDKQYHDCSSGDKPVVFAFDKVKVAPVLCYENAYAKACASSVLAGGNLLVDASDNSWFRLSILSDQMVSFSVLRAVENHRSFVFATALGPSTIIDSCGRILKQAGREQEASLSCEVPVENDLTPFTRWCF